MANGKPWFYTIRRHKKKSIAGAIFAGWLANYGINKYREYLIRRELCQVAKVYGDATLPSLQKPRRLMVFFNPTSGKSGNAADLFKKNAEPILYLAGLDVTTVKTDYEGQIKTLMQYIDPSIDGIIIAGGDGTVLEVITGLLRRTDQAEVCKIPIGVIPLGDHNSLYRRLSPSSSPIQARKIGNAAMAIVKEETHPVDVMEIKGDKGRTTFAVSSIHWGAFRDAISNQDKYWWTGRLRRTMSHIIMTIQDWPPFAEATLSYPAPDTTSPQTFQAVEATSPMSTRPKTQALSTASCQAAGEDPSLLWQPSSFEGTGIDGCTSTPVKTFGMSIEVSEEQSSEVENHLQIHTWSSDFTKTEFIKKGWQMERIEKNPCARNEMNETELRTTHTATALRLAPADSKTSWFTIDGEQYPAQPITVTLLPKKLRFFWNPAGQM